MLLAATQLTPLALLRALQRIERALGRVRSRRWGARTIDLDIVRFGTVSVRERDLVLPHPGLRDRDFWQRELGELAALMREAA
jgi:2-amino-4-hydroxy-6-hydroxymethyldihydropteridine diphosphokinase